MDKNNYYCTFFAFIITRFIKPTLVNGESMYPTLKSHDYLVANRMTYKLSEPKMWRYNDI